MLGCVEVGKGFGLRVSRGLGFRVSRGLGFNEDLGFRVWGLRV